MFYSQQFPIEPKWYYNDELIVQNSNFQQTTTFSTVEVQQHRIKTYVNGLVSNLTLRTEKNLYGEYKCEIRNSYGSVKESFILSKGKQSTCSKYLTYRVHCGRESANLNS